MYQQFFGMTEAPFSIAPNPRYLFMSSRHREAFAHLRYGLGGDGGIILLTGEVGTGKTTVCRCLLEKLPENTKVAFVLNPKLSVQELLETICDELEIIYDEQKPSVKHYVDLLNSYLLMANSAKQHTVVIIDEAQNLSIEVLEQLRLLTNLETNQRKLLQIMLLGQPELQQLLAQPELRQFSQRVIARYHLQPLTLAEVKLYIRHRLAIAGCHRMLFSTAAVNLIYKASNGIPRLINLICDRALLGSYSKNRQQVDKGMVATAVSEVMGSEHGSVTKHVSYRMYWLAASAGAVLLVALGVWVWLLLQPAPTQAIAATPVTTDTVSEPIELVSVSDTTPKVSASVAPIANEMPAPTPVLPTPVEPSPTIERPANKLGVQSMALAYQQLLGLWGFTSELPDDLWSRCSDIMVGPLKCEVKQGQVSDLYDINRPVLLKLYLVDGVGYYPLIAVGEQQFTLWVAREPMILTLPELLAFWRGEFSYFWRPPQGYAGLLKLGSQGEVVNWLEQQMALALHQTPRPDTLKFDTVLQDAVKRFQFQQGLTSDGVVGERTLLRINQLFLNVPQLKSLDKTASTVTR